MIVVIRRSMFMGIAVRVAVVGAVLQAFPVQRRCMPDSLM